MANYREILKRFWGYESFRGIQEEIIESIGSGHDTLGLMPTGGGKSITFQVPALAQPGLCLVITPLIALMKDQVANLKAREIKATAVYSGMTREEILVALENCIFGDYKFLYISPERLATDIFRIKLKKMKVSFITVDESHCISQWGYDFRPAYLEIAQIRKLLPEVPVLALTATATPKVVEDIQEKLEFKQGNVFSMSFERKNLIYVVRTTENKEGELIHILQSVPGSAIIYTRNRKGTKEIAEMLNVKGITALHYHAGLSNSEKDFRQKSWQKGETRVMVATNAFGMGIDKPDVRMVIHLEMPDSPEAYFQEAGRAGRDGKNAYAVLLYSKGDKRKLNKRIADTYPDKDYIRTVYEHLCYYYQMALGDGFECCYEFNLDEFCRSFKHFPVQADSALKILTRAGYIDYTEEQDNTSRIMFLLRREELYHLREQDEETDRLLQMLLRNYTGLFSDYVYIEESLLARKSGLTPQRVYEILKAQSRAGVLHYIPRKRTPYITFTRQRIDTTNIILTREVYEDRKEEYTKRIHAMTDYAENVQDCRSKLLLAYFGEEEAASCKRCDNCLRKSSDQLGKDELEKIKILIRNTLSKDEYKPVTILNQLALPKDKLNQVLESMMEEKELKLQNGLISLR